MALITGTPLGVVNTQETINVSIAPTIFIQDWSASPNHLFNPDSDGFYYNLTGSAAYPVYEVGCVRDVSLTEGLTLNQVRCDNIGVKDTVQQRDYLELAFTITSFFPFTNLTQFLNGSAETINAGEHTSKFGLGTINNNLFWSVWCPAVYDTDTGDYLAVHLHKAKFVEAWTINMRFGQEWEGTGLRLRAHADDNLPTTQQFATVIRADSSVL